MSQDVAKADASSVVLTDPSSIPFTFYIRGIDDPHTPNPLVRAIVHADGKADLFLDKRKTGIEAEGYLTLLANLEAPASFEDRVAALAATGAKIMIDPEHAPFALAERIRVNGGTVI